MIIEDQKFVTVTGFSWRPCFAACIRDDVSRADRTPRRPLAKATSKDGGRAQEPFAALLKAAVEDAQAAQGLALAYAALDTPDRMQLIDAVVNDAEGEGIHAPAVLASMLAVEEDAAVARHIASSMSAGGGAGLTCVESCRAMLEGDEREGRAVLARPLHGHFVELLGLRWEQGRGIVKSIFEPLAHGDELADKAHALEDDRDPRPEKRAGARLEAMPLSFVVDVVTPVLWHHRRLHGSLPDVVARFADLFQPELEPGSFTPEEA
jgi:hypothetical protein